MKTLKCNFSAGAAKKILSVLLIFGIFVSTSFGQSKRSSGSSSSFEGAKSVFFVELLGNGLLFSANIDTRIHNNLGLRAGVGYVGGAGTEGGILTVPVMGNVLLGKNGSYFEIGAGATYISGTGSLFDDVSSSVVGTLSFMYRKQPVDGGFMWKIGLTPFIASGVFIPYWGGVGIGYCW